MKKIVQQDLKRIHEGLTQEEKSRFQGSTVLFTGGAGFLGFYFIQFLTHYKTSLGINGRTEMAENLGGGGKSRTP